MLAHTPLIVFRAAKLIASTATFECACGRVVLPALLVLTHSHARWNVQERYYTLSRVLTYICMELMCTLARTIEFLCK
jgi:hypothetical protein